MRPLSALLPHALRRHLDALPPPWAPFTAAWRHRALLVPLVRRAIAQRYRGSVLGVLWSFVTPLLMVLVYTFVFRVIFAVRWSVEGETPAEFGLVLFAGMIVFWLMAEALARAPALVVGHPSYVKKVVFPLEILPWVVLGEALFQAGMSLVVLLGVGMALGTVPGPTALLVPLVLAPFAALLLGVMWALASLGVFFRDVGHAVGVIITLAMFLTPLFYPLEAVPEGFRAVIYANPLTVIVEEMRAVLIWHRPPDWAGLGLYALVGWAVAWAGYSWFVKTRRAFADVL